MKSVGVHPRLFLRLSSTRFASSFFLRGAISRSSRPTRTHRVVGLPNPRHQPRGMPQKKKECTDRVLPSESKRFNSSD